MRVLCEFFIPLLAAALLAAALRRGRRDYRLLARAALSVLLVLGLMLLDRRFRWWESLGHDFSTHTGVALSLAVALGLRSPAGLAGGLLLVGAYAACMIQAGYHTLRDILSTAAAVLPLALICQARRSAGSRPPRGSPTTPDGRSAGDRSSRD